jgi:hypothetical protein
MTAVCGRLPMTSAENTCDFQTERVARPSPRGTNSSQPNRLPSGRRRKSRGSCDPARPRYLRVYGCSVTLKPFWRNSKTSSPDQPILTHGATIGEGFKKPGRRISPIVTVSKGMHVLIRFLSPGPCVTYRRSRPLVPVLCCCRSRSARRP